MELMGSIKIAASGLRAQTGRMRIIAENLANANSTSSTKGGDPYRRRIPTFQSVFDNEVGGMVVKQGRVRFDQNAFSLSYQPGHPAADDKGYVKTPNVNSLIELTDMRQAQRGYESNLNLIKASRQMLSSTIEILRA